MASLNFSVKVRGDEAVYLRVDVTQEDVILDQGITEIPFTVHNPLDRDVVFSEITVTVEGAAAPQLTINLFETTMTIPAGKSADNKLIVEKRQALSEAETATITVEATES